ncbi:MAG TPA: minichromosome maintenance protein MCM [Dehalococcoidia bacterium]|nr:minichromosome maintenance protein MCM [Dehalococcoidia bacterium]
MDALDLDMEPLREYLTGCGAVPPLDAATMRLDGSLVINLTDLYQYSTELVERLVSDTDKTLLDVSYHVKELLTMRVPELIRDHPVEVHLVGHPDQETPLRSLRSHMIGSLASTSGIVVKITQTEPKIREAYYICQKCGQGIRVPQKMQYRSEPLDRCDNCKGKNWVLDPSHSVFEDIQLLKLQEAPESLPSGQMPRTFTYELRGLLCGRVNAGDRIRITAVIDAAMAGKSSPERRLEMYGRCFGFGYLAEDAEDLECSTEDAQSFSDMAKRQDMFAAVTDSVAPSIYGLREEKQCVAAYLMGGEAKEMEDVRIRGDISVLLIGDPGLAKSQLLKFASKASPRGLYTTGRGSSAAGLTAAVVKDKDIGYSLEAGALVLADRGHVSIDEIEKMEENDRRAIHPAMEQQIVPINKGGINTTLNARCGILGAGNPKDGRYNPYLTVVQNINLEETILNRFDLIRVMKDQPNEERDAALADHLLRVHRGEQVQSPLTLRELRKYVAYCRKHIHPEVPPTVGQQLKEYYLGLRRTKEGDIGDPKQPTIMITPRQFESCIRVTEAVARSRLHEVATEDDALTALGIIEASMEQVGVDPTTGERNIDSWMTGKPKGLHQKLELLRNIIYEMQCEATDGHCDYQTMLQRVTEKGLFKVSELRKFVEQLLLEDASEPVTGKLRILKPMGYTGKARSLKGQLQKTLQLIGEMSTIESGVKDDDLYEALQGQGVTRSEAAKLVSVLMKDGTIFSPRPGIYRRT